MDRLSLGNGQAFIRNGILSMWKNRQSDQQRNGHFVFIRSCIHAILSYFPTWQIFCALLCVIRKQEKKGE